MIKGEPMNGDSSSPLPPADKPDPVVRPVTVSDIVESLADGTRDFQNAPVYGLTFGALYAAGGILIVLSVSALGASYLAYPLAAGFSLAQLRGLDV